MVDGVQGTSLALAIKDLAADFLGIKLRAEILGKFFDYDIRFRQPGRTIIYANLDIDRPKIKFSSRRYNRDPLGFFEKHKDLYCYMSRHELQKFDAGLYSALLGHTIKLTDGRTVKQINVAIPEKLQRDYKGNPLEFFRSSERIKSMSRWSLQQTDRGLYDALLRYGQIDQAILEVRVKKRTEEEKSRIVQAHSLYAGNLNLASRQLGVHTRTISLIWKKHGLRAMGGKGGRPRTLDHNKILEYYNIHNGNCGEAAKSLGIDRRTVWSIWKKHGKDTTKLGLEKVA